MTTPAPIMNARECLQRLAELLTAEELSDLVHALEGIVDRSGYGEIRVDLKKGRIDRIAITETLKPGVMK